jgi:hypothetical protein
MLSHACGSDDGLEPIENEVIEGVDPYCDTRPQFDFCEDFDVRELPGVFASSIVEGAEMRLDDADAASAPRSVLISVEPNGTAVLRHRFEAGGKLRLFGMLHVEEMGTGDVEIGAFEAGAFRVTFGVGADGVLWLFDGVERLTGNGEIPFGRWASFRWDVNLFSDGTGTASLRFGNDLIGSFDALSPPDLTGVPIDAQIGLSSATGVWSMRFDNLTVEVGEASR